MPKPGLTKVIDNVGAFAKSVAGLTETRVFVGIPDDKGRRDDGTISNAALLYIHDNGAPEANIPARPSMAPGMAAVKDQIISTLEKGGQAAFKSKRPKEVVENTLNRIGIIAANSIRNIIRQGIPPPLAESTIKGRIRRVKGKKRRARIQSALDAGTLASRQNGAEGLFTPLIVTAQMMRAITHVLRKVPKKTAR